MTATTGGLLMSSRKVVRRRGVSEWADSPSMKRRLVRSFPGCVCECVGGGEGVKGGGVHCVNLACRL